MALIFLRAFEQDFFDHVRWWYKRTVLAFLFTSHFLLYPLSHGLVLRSGIYFYPGHGVKKLSSAAWWFVCPFKQC